MLVFGRPLYRLLGGEGASLEAALIYSNIVFGGIVLLWLMNALASVIRGTGNMLVPALVICAGAVALVPLSPLLIFGFGPIPAMGIAGGGLALVLYNLCGALVLGWYVLVGPQHRALHAGAAALGDGARDPARRRRRGVSTVQTNVTVAATTALVGLAAGPAAVAGFGTAARLEYLLVPLVFGIGGPLVALVGTNIGAGQRERALRIAWTGARARLRAVRGRSASRRRSVPRAWLGLFGDDPQMIEAGSAYLRAVGPFYGFFGFGLALYFASQGAGKLVWPLLAGFARMAVAIGGGWLALKLTGSLAADVRRGRRWRWSSTARASRPRSGWACGSAR